MMFTKLSITKTVSMLVWSNVGMENESFFIHSRMEAPLPISCDSYLARQLFVPIKLSYHSRFILVSLTGLGVLIRADM